MTWFKWIAVVIVAMLAVYALLATFGTCRWSAGTRADDVDAAGQPKSPRLSEGSMLAEVPC